MKRNLLSLCMAAAVMCTAATPVYAAAETEPAAFDAEIFFVYTGTYCGKPILEYYYSSPGSIRGTDYLHRYMHYPAWEGRDDLNYGDIFLLGGGFSSVKVEGTRATYELQPEEGAKFTKVGNAADLMEHRTLRIDSEAYDGMPMEPCFHCMTYSLSDDDDRSYYYSQESWLANRPVDIENAFGKDQYVEFAVIGDSAIIPLADPCCVLRSGDVNGDGSFGIADLVSFSKFLINKQWSYQFYVGETADYNGDNRITAADFTLMKRALICEDNAPVVFSVESIKLPGASRERSEEIYVINDPAELACITDAEAAPAYDGTFFKTHTLICLQTFAPSGSITERIGGITMNADGDCTIQLRREHPEGMTCDMMPWVHFIAVPKGEYDVIDLQIADITIPYAPPADDYAAPDV